MIGTCDLIWMAENYGHWSSKAFCGELPENGVQLTKPQREVPLYERGVNDAQVPRFKKAGKVAVRQSFEK